MHGALQFTGRRVQEGRGGQGKARRRACLCPSLDTLVVRRTGSKDSKE